MKFSAIYYFIVAFLFMSSCGSDATQTTDKTAEIPTDRVAWMTIEEAQKANQSDPKDIFVMVHAKWCPHCKNFDQTTYLDPKVINDLNTKFYPVKMDAHSNQTITFKNKQFSNPNFDSSKSENELNSYHEVLYELQAGSIPSIVFLDKELNVTGTEMGFKPADELRSLMAMYRRQ